MTHVPEQLVATNKENLEAVIAFAGIHRRRCGKADRAATADRARTSSPMQSRTPKRSQAVKDVQELTEIQTSIAQPLADKITTYGRSVYASDRRNPGQLNKFFEERIAETNKSFVTVLDQAVKNAPAGSDVAVAAVRSAMAAANQAYDAFSKATKQVAEATEATMTAAGSTVATRKKALKPHQIPLKGLGAIPRPFVLPVRYFPAVL